MNRAKFLYVVYIAARREKVWDALIDGEATRRYWGHLNISDWKVGSPWRHERTDGSGKIDLVGTVLESQRPSRLVITWAFAGDADRPEKTSRVTFELEAHAQDHTRLTLLHEDLEAGSEMEQGITAGWPLVLSNLKSWLETGRAMPLQG